jgi:hypothetical protein
MNFLGSSLALLIGGTSAWAQLSITVAPPKVIGQKAIVSLALTNGLAEKVESARAAVFLVDAQGKMVGQATRWIVGGSQDKPGLASGATNIFNVVIANDKPFPTTNLTTRVTVTRLVLEGGKSADVKREVKVEQGGR